MKKIINSHLLKPAVFLALSLICFLYGAMIKAVGSGTGFFLVWLGLGALCLMLAAAIHFQIPEKLPAPLSAMIWTAVILCLLLFLMVEIGIFSHFKDKGDTGADYIIVLGAQVRENGPSVVLKYRLDKAVEYLQANPDTVCIVTGAQGYNEPCTEADCMARYLLAKGIPEDHIIREEKALNTVQNIINSSAFFDPEEDTVGIVTNDFHLYRALHIASKQGLKHVSGIAADSTVFYLPNNCLREFFGVIKDLAKGNMKL